MQLTAEQIQNNWVILMSYINKYISEPRKSKLIEFYNKYQDRIMLMPASHKKEYHNSFPGGYVEHVNRVIQAALDINEVWVKTGVDTSTYTIEELVFSALNHDLGKMGDDENESYLPQTDQWRRDKLGEEWMFNNKLEFMSVPDRGLQLLTSHGIGYTKNEFLSIRLHDGLYDEANKPYLLTWMPEQKPRTSLVFIIHQADLMAARIEFEREWFPKFKGSLTKKTNQDYSYVPSKVKKKPLQQKALGTLKSEGLKNILDEI